MLLLLAAAVGLLAVPRMARSALTGLSESVGEANRLVGLGVAVVLVVAAVTAGGWLLLARRRHVREEPAVAEFSARVQAALDARDRAGARLIASPEPHTPIAPSTPLQQVTAYRLDRVPAAEPGSADGGRR